MAAGLGLADALVPAVPRDSLHDLARFWHDLFVPNYWLQGH
ncbi:hypothetical protein [Streptomyces sp. NPDC086766]